MLEIERFPLIFKTKDIWFSDFPFDVSGYDSVLFQCCKNKAALVGFEYAQQATLVIDLVQDLDMIWKQMKRKAKCRHSIRVATEQGVKIIINQDYDEFFEMNKAFRKQVGLFGPSKSVEFMKKNGILFLGKLDNEVLVGHFYIKDDQNMRILFGASKRFEAEKRTIAGDANKLAIWEAIKYGKENGLAEYDFGGYYIGEEKADIMHGINAFKSGFGGRLVTRYTYRKDYSRVYRLARRFYEALNTGPEVMTQYTRI